MQNVVQQAKEALENPALTGQAQMKTDLGAETSMQNPSFDMGQAHPSSFPFPFSSTPVDALFPVRRGGWGVLHLSEKFTLPILFLPFTPPTLISQKVCHSHL